MSQAAYQDYLKRQNIGWDILTEAKEWLQPGINEVEAHEKLTATFKNFNITDFWHPTCIKFDTSTLKPGVRHKASKDTCLQNMAIIDIGIIINGFEVDCGRSFGFNDETKKLAQTSEDIFLETKQKLKQEPTLAPADIYKYICDRATHHNYEQIAPTAGHSLGAYPTPKRDPKISPKDSNSQLTPEGWMIEVHISDSKNGAFFEDLIWV